jgi:hypothetical protein
MHYRKATQVSENETHVRSFLIWERECRPEGKAEEHWLRAKTELEAEFEAECVASFNGNSTTFVVPLLLISSPPIRINSVETDTTSGPALSRAA